MLTEILGSVSPDSTLARPNEGGAICPLFLLFDRVLYCLLDAVVSLRRRGHRHAASDLALSESNDLMSRPSCSCPLTLNKVFWLKALAILIFGSELAIDIAGQGCPRGEYR